MVVYYADAGVATKIKHRQRKANIPTIVMHVDVICAFAWMCQYAEPISVFLNRITLLF